MTVERIETYRFKFLNKTQEIEPGSTIVFPGWAPLGLGDKIEFKLDNKDEATVNFLGSNVLTTTRVFRGEEINALIANAHLAEGPKTSWERFLKKRIEYAWRQEAA